MKAQVLLACCLAGSSCPPGQAWLSQTLCAAMPATPLRARSARHALEQVHCEIVACVYKCLACSFSCLVAWPDAFGAQAKTVACLRVSNRPGHSHWSVCLLGQACAEQARSIALQLAIATAHAARCHSGAAASTSGVAVAAAARGPRTGGWREQLQVYKQLSKFRLSALVVSTAAAGYVMGAPAAIARVWLF